MITHETTFSVIQVVCVSRLSYKILNTWLLAKEILAAMAMSLSSWANTFSSGTIQFPVTMMPGNDLTKAGLVLKIYTQSSSGDNSVVQRIISLIQVTQHGCTYISPLKEHIEAMGSCILVAVREEAHFHVSLWSTLFLNAFFELTTLPGKWFSSTSLLARLGL